MKKTLIILLIILSGVLTPAFASKDYSFMTPKEKQEELEKEKALMVQARITNGQPVSSADHSFHGWPYVVCFALSVWLFFVIMLPKTPKGTPPGLG